MPLSDRLYDDLLRKTYRSFGTFDRLIYLAIRINIFNNLIFKNVALHEKRLQSL